MIKQREIICEYQEYFDFPPQQQDGLYSQACSSDGITINTWRETWVRQIRENHENHGPFKDNGIGKLFGTCRNMPAILVGSGPSLKLNALHLHKNQGIPVISCLHNFHFLEDSGIHVDYYVSLDAGPVTIEEVSEGGKRKPEEYWEATKDKTLIAFIGSHPDLISKWQGKIYWFNSPLPDPGLEDEIAKIEDFRTVLSTGGNVLGACTYFAKAILGSATLVYVGADFSFSYSEGFHPWNSKYDGKLGHTVKLTDIFGNKVKTWRSYANFKSWFDWLVQRVPGIWINATEGGCFGSYPQGNIRHLKQMDLSDVFEMFNMCDQVKDVCLKPETGEQKILF